MAGNINLYYVVKEPYFAQAKWPLKVCGHPHRKLLPFTKQTRRLSWKEKIE